METPAKKRPASVTVIGWIFIGFGVFMILSGSMAFVAFTIMEQMPELESPPGPGEIPGPLGVAAVLFQHFDTLALLQVLIAVFVILASIQFLKLRAWARTALETVSWLSLVCLVGFFAFWLASWIGMASVMTAQDTGSLPRIFAVLGAAGGTMVMAAYAVPHIVIIKFLRGRTIKEAVTQARY